MLSSQLRRSRSRSIDSTSTKTHTCATEPYMELCIACQATRRMAAAWESFVCWWPGALVGLRALLAEFSRTGVEMHFSVISRVYCTFGSLESSEALSEDRSNTDVLRSPAVCMCRCVAFSRSSFGLTPFRKRLRSAFRAAIGCHCEEP